MSDPINVRRIIHVIHACNDYHTVRLRYMNVFGALVFGEGYQPEADRDMNLFYVGDFMIEPMAPRWTKTPTHPMANIFQGYLNRFGEGWHSYEVGVDNVDETVERLKAMNMRISPGVPFTHPLDSFGMSIEIVGGGKYAMRNDPIKHGFDLQNWFRSDHPLTLEGLDSIVHIVSDTTAARDHLVNVWGATPITEDKVMSPEPMDRAIVELGGTRFVLIKPTGEQGPVTDTIKRRMLGIYSLAWKVGSLEQVKTHLADVVQRTQKQIPGDPIQLRVEEGTSVLGGICIHPDDMFGARHEFIEA